MSSEQESTERESTESPETRRISPGDAERIVELVQECLGRMREGGPEALAEFVAEHPTHRSAILERISQIGRYALSDAITRPNRLGHYELEEELGRGGQGVVYRATDLRLGRKVAIKMLLSRRLSESALRRFRMEAVVASRLEHPGICTIYEVDCEGDVPYIVMPEVDGIGLDAMLRAARRGPLDDAASTHVVLTSDSEEGIETSPGESGRRDGDSSKTPTSREEIRAVCALIERAAHALHAAHETGLIHRDVKPGNIMVTPGNLPVILDFGLARDASGDAALTQSGALVGTPAYMSPEQITPGDVPLDRRTDVYSLGVTLFECLTLRRPYEASTRESLFGAILEGRVPDVRQLNRAVSKDLKVVVEKALEVDLDRRYATALDLAQELRRVRENRPIVARPVSSFERLVRWSGRNPALATSLALLFIVLSTALGVSQYLLRARNLALRDAAVSAERASAARDQSLSLAGVSSEMAAELLVRGQRALVERYIAEADAYFRVFDVDVANERELFWYVRTRNAVASIDTLLGDLETTSRAHAENLRMLEARLREHPNEVRALVNRSVARLGLAEARERQGRVEEAIDLFERDRAQLEAAIERIGPNPSLEHALGRSLMVTSDLVRRETDPQASFALGERALPFLRRAVETGIDGAEHGDLVLDVVGALLSRSRDLRAMSRLAEARPPVLEAMEMVQRLCVDDPGNTVWRRERFLLREELAVLHMELGEREAAASAFAAARDEIRALHLADTGRRDHLRDLALVRKKLAQALAALARTDEAEAEFTASIGDFERLVELEGTNELWRRDLLKTRIDAASFFVADQRPGPAQLQLDAIDGAALIAEARAPDADFDVLGLAASYSHARAQTTQDDAERVAAFRETMDIMRRLYERNTGHANAVYNFAVTATSLGAQLVANGEPDEAQAVLMEGVALIQESIGSSGDDVDFDLRLQLGRLLRSLGDGAYDAGDLETAGQHYERAVEEMRFLRRVRVESEEARQWYARSLLRVAELRTRQLRPADALAVGAEALELALGPALAKDASSFQISTLLYSLLHAGIASDNGGRAAASEDRHEDALRSSIRGVELTMAAVGLDPVMGPELENRKSGLKLIAERAAAADRPMGLLDFAEFLIGSRATRLALVEEAMDDDAWDELPPDYLLHVVRFLAAEPGVDDRVGAAERALRSAAPRLTQRLTALAGATDAESVAERSRIAVAFHETRRDPGLRELLGGDLVDALLP